MTQILSAHVTHKWASIEELELVAAKEAASLLNKVHGLDGIDECIVLKTCNRVEVYAATDSSDEAMQSLESLLGPAVCGIPKELIRYMDGENSLRHLLRVACGLESMIIGEDQILGQVRDAFELAKKEGTVKSSLTTAFQKALQVGKLARERTRINKGCVSIGSAAVELAEGLVGTLENKTLVVVGSGMAARLVAKSMRDKELKRIYFACRDPSHADHLASEVGGLAVPYSSMEEYIGDADVLICATSAPHVILSRKELEDAFRDREPGRSLLVIDIGSPRNVDENVQELEGVELHNIDGLRKIADENLRTRIEEVKKVEDIIENELGLLIARYKTRDAEEIVRALYSNVRLLKENEYEKAMRKLDGLDDEQRAVILDLINSLSNKILAVPTLALKTASKNGDSELLRSAVQLFNLGGGAPGDKDVP